MKRPMVLMVCALVLVFGTIFGVIYGKQHLIARYLGSYRPPPVTVSTQAVRTEHWPRSITAVGTLQAVQGVDVATETAGTVSRLHFRPGDTVEKGTELVSLEDSVEVATLKSLVAQRRLAEINFERDQRLLRNSAISRTDFDKTESLLKDVSAQVEKTEAIIARKHLRAAFAGRIGIPMVKEGEYVTEGEALVTLQALESLDVDFSLPEQQLPLIATGQRVRCAVQAFPDQAFDGEVIAIDAKIDGNTRNVLVRARVPNTTLALLPGMFVSAELIIAENVEFTTVPETAVSYNLYGDSIFLVRTRSTAEGEDELFVERRYVTVGERRNGRVALPEGATPGEAVVVAGALKLDDGAAIVVDNTIDLGR
jgi:RND family efflux transporter MFP subunit